MSSSVTVNLKYIIKKYLYLIKLRLREDRFPINARMTESTIEKNRNGQRDQSGLICLLTLVYSNLSMFARGSLLVKTGKKCKFINRNKALRSVTNDYDL